ncbi:hypothetical protein Apa02nite_016560 [Actinoplanes palleronii]|uniref:Uncharacterized protein n=1 Tax=Actinoplanes palleronii TaxID=113570 RepID=A0ABQ4B4G4_9ACTN|nr:hypothetical protein Apa02nite_016560 [Actinoplanes palleronii]
MVNRRRVATNVRVLAPEVVPMSPEEYQQAVTALAQMIEQWWRNHHDDEPSDRDRPADLPHSPLVGRPGQT